MNNDISSIEFFLNNNFGKVSGLTFIAEGWWSKAFYFLANSNEYVFRLGKHLKDFRKDKLAYDLFHNQEIPIPRVIDYGKFNGDCYYCISEFIQGMPSDTAMETLDKLLRSRLAKKIVNQLIRIHQLDTTALKGWGFVSEHGEGLFPSWQDFLLSFYNSKSDITWQQLAETSWLDAELFEQLIEKMKSYFPFLPNDKHVLHGDFGFDNLLLDGNHEVVAVIDWAELLLGDPLYELMHMNEPWREDSELNFLEVWLSNNIDNEAQLLHLDKRCACYRIHYTLMHMHIHTVRSEHTAYLKIAAWARENLL